MTQINIEELEAKGFKRWTKGNYDRMYINPDKLGLELDFYNSGNICFAKLDGEKISNSRASKLRYCKTYLDLKTGKVYSDADVFKATAEALINA